MQDENLQATRELRPLLDEVLAATMELQDADSGTIQLYLQPEIPGFGNRGPPRRSAGLPESLQ